MMGSGQKPTFENQTTSKLLTFPFALKTSF